MDLPHADALVHRLPVPVRVFALDGDAPRLRYANTAAEAFGALGDPRAWPDDLARAFEEAAMNGVSREVRVQANGADLHVRLLPFADQTVALVIEPGEGAALLDARASLSASEERLRLATESAGIGTWDLDPATGHLFWDARCNAAFGLAPDASVDYEGFLNLLHPEDRDRTDAIVQASTDPGGSGEYDTAYRVIWPSGEIRWIHARGRALFAGEGTDRVATRFLGTVRDITEERTAAMATQAAQARTRALLDAASDVILVYPLGPDGPGVFSDFNDAAVATYGYTAEELAEMSLPDLLGPSGARRLSTVLSDLVNDREVRYDIVHRAKDGRLIPVETTARLIELDGELAVLSISRDGSERRTFLRELARVNNALEQRVAERTGALEERERAIQRLSIQLQSILDAAGDGIYGLDLDGRTTFMNPAAAVLTGWRVDECVGVSQHDQIHHHRADGSAYPREECPIHAVMQDGHARTVTDEVFWRKDGTSFPVEYVSTPLYEDGEIMGSVVVFRPRPE